MDIRGDIVKQIRVQNAWTQAQLAEICDVNLRTIQRVENQGNASLETVMALCIAFNVKRQVLFTVPKPSELESNQVNFTRVHVIIFVAGIMIGLIGALIPVVYF